MDDEQTSIADLISHALVGISTAQRLLTAARPRAGADAVELDSLRDEVAALREIIAGRTTPPTDAEIAAHAAAGGGWLVKWVVGTTTQRIVGDEFGAVHGVANVQEWRDRSEVVRWIALDADGRPCTWPTANGGAT